MPRRGTWLGLFALIAVLLALIVPTMPARADDTPPLLAAPGGPWQQPEVTLKQHFAITYIQREPVAAQVDTYRKISDAVFDMETDIFGTMLPQPVPIYLFNDMTQFTTAVPAAQSDINIYSAIDNGGIYIAVPRMNALKPADLTLNLRMLLTQQIVQTMSGNNLPAGFLRGLSLYGEAPPAELSGIVTTLGQQVGANQFFDWMTMASSTDPAFAAQEYSVFAFLIDTYGFRSVRTWLTTLAKQKDWRAALQTAYINKPNAATTLEAEWRAYLPQFLGGLWQRNQFTYYNIDEATQLVGVGQYSQAVTVLTPAIAFLQQIGNPKRATDAQQLLSKARAGSEAEARVRDAQQALEGNDYARTNDLLKQAIDLYKAVPDAKPPLLIGQYQQRVTRGLQATSDLELAEAQVSGWNVIRARQRANSALGTFTEFGNTPLADRAQAVIDRANSRIQMAGLGVIGVGAIILLGGFAIIGIRRGRRPTLPALPPLE
jgi:hypothetical protein